MACAIDYQAMHYKQRNGCGDPAASTVRVVGLLGALDKGSSRLVVLAEPAMAERIVAWLTLCNAKQCRRITGAGAKERQPALSALTMPLACLAASTLPNRGRVRGTQEQLL